MRIDVVAGVKRYVREGIRFMTTLTTHDLEHMFEALRKGLVPERGLDAFAVGIEKQRGEMQSPARLGRSR